MILDAREVTMEEAPYRPGTVRRAIYEAMHSMQPGQKIHVQRVLDPEGCPVPPRNLQIGIAQVVPEGWKVFTERDAEGGVTIYRFS